MSVLPGQGTSTLGARVDYSSPEGAVHGAVIDLDRDRRPDLVVATFASAVRVFLNRTPSPTSVTGPATRAKGTSATLTGEVNPRGLASMYRFEYGTTRTYGTLTPAQSAGSGTSFVAAATKLSKLRPKTTYHYRLVATNSAGVGRGQDLTLTTGR